DVAARWCMPVVDHTPDEPGWPALRDAVADLLDAADARLAGIVLADCGYPGSPIADRVAITQANPGLLTGLDELDSLRVGLFARRHTLVVHRGHPLTREALALAVHEPEVAAYLLVKAFRLGRGLDAALDTRWIERVVERRWATSTG
ncbi:MAG: hypothetical protein IAG13_37330, partial [Deltaproteobacteria bacterium]|nr:hypothetical protein [Nannocystaceae bacterium]